jgi:LmbE family N-acetylglucosaminyl deacetylase
MRSYYDTIYLSPHLDDAALSCGGQIFQQCRAGQSVLVVTLMAGDAPLHLTEFAQSLHERWELGSDAAAQRRWEDENAFALLGADVLHWDFPDCAYRYHPYTGAAMYCSAEDIFGEIMPVERDEANGLLGQMMAQLRGLPSCGRILVPLTIGHHVDHQLTRIAAEKVFDPATLVYYEDYPYVVHGLSPHVFGEGEAWQNEVVKLSAAAVIARYRAIADYTSQIYILFGTLELLAEHLPAHVAKKGGEVLWRRESPAHATN